MDKKRVKSFILFHRGSEAEDNWVKPTMPTDLLRPAIKFGHLDTQGKAAVLGKQQFTFVCACVCEPLTTTPTATSVSFN